MSWLEEQVYDFLYECADGHLWALVDRKPEESLYADRPCIQCQAMSKYVKFVPKEQISLVTKVAYEHNGRLGYRFSDGKGNVSYMSQSKYHYKEKNEIKGFYSDGFKEHIAATGDTTYSPHEARRGKGSVSYYKGEGKK